MRIYNDSCLNSLKNIGDETIDLVVTDCPYNLQGQWNNFTTGGERKRLSEFRKLIKNEDCLEALKEVKDESIDLVVTDCPYHIVSGGCSTGAYGNKKKGTPGGLLERNPKAKMKIDENGDYYIPIEHGNRLYTDTKHISLGGCLNDYAATTYARQGKLFKHNDIKFSEWLPELYRVLKPNTHIYIYINARNLKELQTEAEKVGFKFQNILIWNKGNATPNKYYLNAYEMILMLRKGNAKNINNMGTKNILNVKNIIGKKTHPTEKPVELNKILIENSSKEGDIVLDPFMGTGSCGVACKETGREFVGIEIDERYYNIAKERLEPKETQTTIEEFI